MVVAFLLAGCAAKPLPGPAPTTSPAHAAEPVELANQHNRLTYPQNQVVHGAVAARFEVPANQTRLDVQVTFTLGAAVNLHIYNVPGCERTFLAARLGDVLAYSCQAPAGNQTLMLADDAGASEFDLLVLARAP